MEKKRKVMFFFPFDKDLRRDETNDDMNGVSNLGWCNGETHTPSFQPRLSEFPTLEFQDTEGFLLHKKTHQLYKWCQKNDWLTTC